MPYPVPPPPPLVPVAVVSYADVSLSPDVGPLAEAERQVLLPEPMAPRRIASIADVGEVGIPRGLPDATLIAAEPGDEAGTDDSNTSNTSSLGPALEVGLPAGSSLPGSQFGNLQRDHGLNEEKALALESDARTRLASDEAPYEEAAILLHESRGLLSELVNWVAQQSETQQFETQQFEVQVPSAQDATIPSDLQAPLPVLDPAAVPTPAPETNAIPLEELDLSEPDEAAGEAVGGIEALEVISDSQVYSEEQQSFIAEGDVTLTVRGSVLTADEVRVNLPNQIAIATGNVVFSRGEQVLRGDRIEYNFVREEGAVLDARGQVFIPQVGSDLSSDRPVANQSTASQGAAVDVGIAETDVLSDRLGQRQPEIQTATSTGGVTIGAGISSRRVGNQSAAGGSIRQLRFEAERIDFRPGGWVAENVRLTNDPFSPPELEIRTNRATFQRLSATRSELRLKNPRLVLDQGLTIPLLRSRFVFDQRQRDPLPVQFGFDEDDRDGLFAESPFEMISTSAVQLTVTPQFFIQRSFVGRDESDIDPGEDDTGLLNLNSYGLTSDLSITFDPLTSLESEAVLTSLDIDGNFADEDLRGLVRLRRDTRDGYTFTGEYSYRDRLFNGTLGFQTVDQSFGVIATSPEIELGDSGVRLTYQGSIQRITDDIDVDRRDDILGPIEERDDNNTTLTRYQVAAEARRFYLLWAGTPLPATPDEGLRYTASPVVPFVGFNPRVRGVAGLYSSGDTQPILTGELSFFGQFGHFSKPAFDYLGFNLTYRRSTEGTESPFTFDQVPDREVLSGGLTAQLLGPIRVGFQTSISLSEDENFDTNFSIEYSRRTFGLILRVNPDREIGSFNLRISDFTWAGTPRRFDSEPIDYESELVDPESVDFPSDNVIDAGPAGVEPIESEPTEPESIEVEPAEPGPIEVDPIETDALEIEPGEAPRDLSDTDLDAIDPDSIDRSDLDVPDLGLPDLNLPNLDTLDGVPGEGSPILPGR